MKLMQDVIGAIRNIRGEMNIPPDKKAPVLFRGPAEQLKTVLVHAVYLEKLAGISELKTGEAVKKPRESATALVQGLEIILPLEGLIDLEAERTRIGKEIVRHGRLLKDITLKLSNHEFLQKAPPEVVEKEKQKQKDIREKFKKLKESLKALGPDSL